MGIYRSRSSKSVCIPAACWIFFVLVEKTVDLTRFVLTCYVASIE